MESKITEEMIKDYVRTLNKVLKSRDVERFKRFINANLYLQSEEIREIYRQHENDDEWLKGSMAKMILNSRKMDLETRRWAFEQLHKLGWDKEVFKKGMRA